MIPDYRDDNSFLYLLVKHALDRWDRDNGDSNEII